MLKLVRAALMLGPIATIDSPGQRHSFAAAGFRVARRLTKSESGARFFHTKASCSNVGKEDDESAGEGGARSSAGPVDHTKELPMLSPRAQVASK